MFLPATRKLCSRQKSDKTSITKLCGLRRWLRVPVSCGCSLVYVHTSMSFPLFHKLQRDHLFGLHIVGDWRHMFCTSDGFAQSIPHWILLHKYVRVACLAVSKGDMDGYGGYHLVSCSFFPLITFTLSIGTSGSQNNCTLGRSVQWHWLSSSKHVKPLFGFGWGFLFT